jgi:hypothetical protein
MVDPYTTGNSSRVALHTSGGESHLFVTGVVMFTLVIPKAAEHTATNVIHAPQRRPQVELDCLLSYRYGLTTVGGAAVSVGSGGAAGRTKTGVGPEARDGMTEYKCCHEI